MPHFRVEIKVMPRDTLLDPQGQAVENALRELEFEGLSRVRIGRALTFELESTDRTAAEAGAQAMCQKLLANPVTEDYSCSATEI